MDDHPPQRSGEYATHQRRQRRGEYLCAKTSQIAHADVADLILNDLGKASAGTQSRHDYKQHMMWWRSPQLKEKPLRLSIYYYSMNYALTNKEGLLSANKSSLAILLIAFALLLAAFRAGSSITPVEQMNVGEAVRQWRWRPMERWSWR